MNSVVWLLKIVCSSIFIVISPPVKVQLTSELTSDDDKDITIWTP